MYLYTKDIYTKDNTIYAPIWEWKILVT
jgi:hypothetical protein